MNMMSGWLLAIRGGAVSVILSAQTSAPHRECARLTSLALPDIKIAEAVAAESFRTPAALADLLRQGAERCQLRNERPGHRRPLRVAGLRTGPVVVLDLAHTADVRSIQ